MERFGLSRFISGHFTLVSRDLARDALAYSMKASSGSAGPKRPLGHLIPNPKLRFLDQCREVLRFNQMAGRPANGVHVTRSWSLAPHAPSCTLVASVAARPRVTTPFRRL